MRLPQGPGHGLCVSAPPGSLQVPTLVSLTPSSHRPQTQPLSPRSTYCRRTGQRDADEASLSEEVVAPAWRELVWFQGRMFRVNTSQADQDHRCGTGAPEQFLGGLSQERYLTLETGLCQEPSVEAIQSSRLKAYGTCSAAVSETFS